MRGGVGGCGRLSPLNDKTNFLFCCHKAENNKDDNIHKSEALKRQVIRRLTLVKCQN